MVGRVSRMCYNDRMRVSEGRALGYVKNLTNPVGVEFCYAPQKQVVKRCLCRFCSSYTTEDQCPTVYKKELPSKGINYFYQYSLKEWDLHTAAYAVYNFLEHLDSFEGVLRKIHADIVTTVGPKQPLFKKFVLVKLKILEVNVYSKSGLHQGATRTMATNFGYTVRIKYRATTTEVTELR
ncbi:hypothetical protein BDA99DRAFT_534385 [Phascolomyces articulosus]|uniref:Uncharacterized protein n=1 Tax=Phascolomyces articulosus TaxID=60185 RepID=A0AAD5PGZ2_9FUNG|nr:hypothetical protein BDA99DRAFT_534385 [Phascolomyces articulosus]